MLGTSRIMMTLDNSRVDKRAENSKEEEDETPEIQQDKMLHGIKKKPKQTPILSFVVSQTKEQGQVMGEEKYN